VIHASLAADVIEQVWEDCGSEVGVLIVGDPGKEQDQVVQDAEKKGMLVKYWEEVWTGAEASKKVMPGKLSLLLAIAELTRSEAQPQDVHSYFYSDSEEPTVVKVTHQAGPSSTYRI
jgi:hypothetical protein